MKWRARAETPAPRPEADPTTKGRLYGRCLYALFALGLLYSAGVLALSWRLPLLDMHAFRQTQTAISVQWMALGSPLLAYETPVIGYPWTTPFEFPLFQWSALLLHRLGVDMDNAGRLASWLYFIGGLPLAAFTIRRWGGDRYFTLIFVTLWLFSPLYVYWSRSYMIESCATFLGLAFLAGLTAYLKRTQARALSASLAAPLALTTLAAVLASLVKVTTFFGFAMAGAGLTVWTMWTVWRARQNIGETLGVGIGPALAVGASLAATAAWVTHIDATKAQAPIAALMTSAELLTWNFGWEQILAPVTWTKVIFGRASLDTLGSRLAILIALASAALLPRARLYLFAGLLLYLAPFFVFTNLHVVHNYYQYANAFFLIFAVAGGVWALGGVKFGQRATSSLSGSPALVLTLMLILLIGELSAFQSRFFPALRPSPNKQRTLELAGWIKQAVAPDEVVFIFGRGWSPELPYYAERRAVMFPTWSASVVVQTAPSDLYVWAGGRTVGAVVDCGEQDAKLQAWAHRAVLGRTKVSISSCNAYN